VFTPKTLDDIGGHAAVAQALRRLTKGGNIRRVSRGVYDVPINHATLGRISADAENVTKAIADQSGFRLQPTPVRAPDLLGLSAQVPAQIVYLIEGSSRRIKVANQIIHFRHAGPRTLLGAGTPAGVAIRAFGPENITDGVIQQLRHNLTLETKTGLKELARHTPPWLASVINAVTA
jgi:hypothetical protein